jgi:hypothetical protein
MTQAPPYDASALLSSSSLPPQSHYLIRPCLLTRGETPPQRGASRLMATRPWSPSTPGVDMCLHADGCRWGRVGGRGSPVAAPGSIACLYEVAHRGTSSRCLGEQS